MYKILLLLPILISCAHRPTTSTEREDLVSLETALFQARSSYLLGCTEARVELKEKDAFNYCSDR
ncbi:MAG TPA: hypothetical protein VKY27_04875, partial [Bacteriovoracaceae bacterium]|nr:hypothetical protein [Bacteriovoracaceae bacterium]